MIVRTGVPGTCAVIPAELDGCNCSDLVIVRPNTDLVDPYYLCAFINSWGRAQVSNVKVGAIQKHFNISSAADMMIPMIDLEEQHKIGGLIRKINTLIDNNAHVCYEIESIGKTLYDYWFLQFEFPDKEGKPYKSNKGKMVWNEALNKEIPDSWQTVTLPIVCDLQYGYPLSTGLFGEEGRGVVRIRDIANNSISAHTEEKVGMEYLTTAGDLLVGMDGNFQMNYWTHDGEVVNQRITRIRKKDMPIMIIKMQIEPYIKAKVDNVARSTVGHLSDSDFKEQIILKPDNVELSCFDKLLQIIISLRNENQQLASLRDFLLPMLVNGQIKVVKSR